MKNKHRDKCSMCGQDRPFVPIFIRGVAGYPDVLSGKCKECDRLPADNPAVIQGMKWKEKGVMA